MDTFNASGVVDSIPEMILLPGCFPLWPVNRLFANLVGTSNRIEWLLRNADVEPGDETFGGQIASRDVARLLRQVAWAARDETWGLRSKRTRLGTFKQACDIAVHGRTVEVGLRAAFRFYHGAIDDFRIHLSIASDYATITVTDRDPDRPARDVLHILILHSLLILIEWLGDKSWVPTRIVLRHAIPPHVEQLERVFRTTITGHASVTKLILPSVILQRPIMAQANRVADFVTSMFVAITRLLPNVGSLAARTAGCIASSGNWEIQRNEVAALVGVSAATLNRHLRLETGAGFQAIKDLSRQKVARELMTIPDLTLEDIAHRLGFAELSSFHRAFRRWYDQTPGEYREIMRLSLHG